MDSSRNKCRVVIVAHKFLTQPDDDLVLFLNREKYGDVLHIRHSFSDAPDRKSFFTWYRQGLLHQAGSSRDYAFLPEPLIYCKEFFFTLWWTLRARGVWDAYVGVDGLLVAFGLLLRFLHRTRKLVFWAIDFVPSERFDSAWKNRIYKKINTLGYRRADEMWDLSPRMAEAREKFLGIKKKDYRSHKVMPYGVWTERIPKYSYEECEKNTLVFMGHLLEKQGVQLVIQALPEIIKRIPDFRFKIIGDGNYREKLVKYATASGVLKYCDFRGKIESIEELEREVAKSALAIAPYIRHLDTWTYYADPGKVKTYLACGLPVLLTDLPWNAASIVKNECGVIISEETQDIARNIEHLLLKENNERYRENAKKYAEEFDYKNIFKQAMLC